MFSPLVRFILLFIPFSFTYYSIFLDMVSDWWLDPNYSHGFIIPVVSLYILWEKRDSLKTIEKESSMWGCFFILLGIGLFLVGKAGGEFFSMRLSMLLVLGGMVLSTFGKQFFKEIFFPYLLLIFMIPLPYILYNSLTLPLKSIATQLSTLLMSFFSMPVLREGNIIHLPTIDLQVVEACSGIRSLISLMALGTIFAYFLQTSNLKRSILIISTIPIAIFTNGLRIGITGMLATFVSPELAHNFFHLFSGWVVFIMAIALLILLNKVLNLSMRFKVPHE